MTGFFPSSTGAKAPARILPACGVCGLFKKCESPKMVPYGEGRKSVLIVGEFPDDDDDSGGRPFLGEAGDFLRKTLRGIGVNLDRDATSTSALICHSPGNMYPNSKQIGYCHPNLVNTIREVQPKVIVTLGRAPLVSVLTGVWDDIKTMERWIGWKIPLKKFWVCPTYHPSHLLRMRNTLMDRQFSDHLEAAFAIEEDPVSFEDEAKQIEILYDETEILRAIRWMHNHGGWVAVDYETNCLKPEYEKAEIVSCAMSNGELTISYPWVGDAREATGYFLESAKTKKIASNLRFEERWTLKEFGRGVNNWGWDTVIASHCLDNRPGICSLKFQAFVKMGVPVYNAHIEPFLQSYRGPYNRIREIDLNSLLLYGGMDALWEYRLAMIQRKEMGYGE